MPGHLRRGDGIRCRELVDGGRARVRPEPCSSLPAGAAETRGAGCGYQADRSRWLGCRRGKHPSRLEHFGGASGARGLWRSLRQWKPAAWCRCPRVDRGTSCGNRARPQLRPRTTVLRPRCGRSRHARFRVVTYDRHRPADAANPVSAQPHAAAARRAQRERRLLAGGGAPAAERERWTDQNADETA